MQVLSYRWIRWAGSSNDKVVVVPAWWIWLNTMQRKVEDLERSNLGYLQRCEEMTVS